MTKRSIIQAEAIPVGVTGEGKELGRAKKRGRPKGATTKVSAKSILDHIKATVGKSFEQCLAESYNEALLSGNRDLAFRYENAIMNKVIVNVIDVNTSVTDKRLANLNDADFDKMIEVIVPAVAHEIINGTDEDEED